MKPICKNCRLSEWVRDSRGRVISNYSGECKFDLGRIRLPACATGAASPTLRKSGIVYSDERECEVFIPIKEEKPLRIWNGRGYCAVKRDDPLFDHVKDRMKGAHFYVCATSREDARRIIEAYTGTKPSAGEARGYWSEAWGNAMRHVPRERGLWIKYDHDSAGPVQVWPNRKRPDWRS